VDEGRLMEQKDDAQRTHGQEGVEMLGREGGEDDTKNVQALVWRSGDSAHDVQ